MIAAWAVLELAVSLAITAAVDAAFAVGLNLGRRGVVAVTLVATAVVPALDLAGGLSLGSQNPDDPRLALALVGLVALVAVGAQWGLLLWVLRTDAHSRLRLLALAVLMTVAMGLGLVGAWVVVTMIAVASGQLG